MSNSKRREEIQKIILALLVTHKEAIDIVTLENEYMEQMGEHVPWRSFGHVSLLDFLQNMPNIRMERRYNKYYVRALPTEKSNHITSLVANQRSQPKRKLTSIRTFKPSHYYPKTERPKIRLPAELLWSIVKLVKEYPKGITKDFVLLTINKNYPYINVCLQDLEDQLRELSHEVVMEDNLIYPVKTNKYTTNNTKKVAIEQSKGTPRHQVPSPKYYVSDGEDSFDDYDSDDNPYSSNNFAQHVSSTGLSSSVDKMTTCRFLQESVTKQQEQLNNYDPVHESTKDNKIPVEDDNAQMLINDRLKFRLEKLIEKYSNGIWCAQLPEKFFEEYKMELKYTELGFNSVREFASQLKDIFHCVQPSSTGDCILYDAKKMVPNNTKSQENHMTLTELHCTQFEDDIEAMPAIVSTDTSKKLIPEGVMTIGETVGQICVDSLMNDIKPFVEVYVVEVFTPSFFWVQLRKKKKAFDTLMAHLSEFYTKEYKRYVIPPVVLEKGLNCACLYGGIWHRGIIKSVNPDLHVTVLFYDYGTVKTYSACDIYYLDRKFSYLPAQAIPCGLINTQPKDSDQWCKQVTYAFAVKTSQIPLVATIGSIDIDNNSMMVTLTNTLEDEDVHINDWLVEQNLAVHGTMVRIRCRNFLFLYYVKCRDLLKTVCQISEEYANSVRNVNKPNAKVIRERIALCDSRTVLKSPDQLYEDRCDSFDRSDYVGKHRPPKPRLKSGLSSDFVNVVQSEPSCDNSCYRSTDVEVTSMMNASTPSGPKELHGLLEEILSSNTTRKSSESPSTTKENISSLQCHKAVSKINQQTSNSGITKFDNSPRLAMSKSTGKDTILPKEAKKSENPSNVQDKFHDNKIKQVHLPCSNINEKPAQEFTCDFVPLKQSEYRFSPTNSVIDDANSNKFYGEFNSTCRGRGAMPSIDWSVLNSNNTPDESRNSLTKPSKSPETQPNIIQETRDVSSSDHSLPPANSQFLNSVRHCLQPADEVVYRQLDGNINKHHSISELVLRRRKIYLQEEDRVIGIPQKMLNVFRGTTLPEDGSVAQQVDRRQLTEHKYSDEKDVQSNEATIIEQSKHGVDNTISRYSETNRISLQCEKQHKNQINGKKDEDLNSSSEVVPQSTISSLVTSENIISSESDIRKDNLKSKCFANDSLEHPEVQGKLSISEQTIEDIDEIESLPEELAKGGDIPTDNVVCTNYNDPSSEIMSKKYNILEIMERYKNVDDRCLDSDDLSSADESESVDDLACSHIITKSLQINEVKDKSHIIDKPVDENSKLPCQLVESEAEQNEEQQIGIREVTPDTVITDKSNVDEDADDSETQEIQEAATVIMSVQKNAPVFNDIDIDSEDDDEWDAFMGSFDTQKSSQFSPNTVKCNREESDTDLKIVELNDADVSVDGKDNCSSDVEKARDAEKESNEYSTPLIMSEQKSRTNSDVNSEETSTCERECLRSSHDNTVRDTALWLPHGKRKTLIDLLNKVKSPIK